MSDFTNEVTALSVDATTGDNQIEENSFGIVPADIEETQVVVVPVQPNPSANVIASIQENIDSTETEIELLNLKLKALKLHLAKEKKRSNTPTTTRTASLNVYVSGKHRQLHNTDEGQLYYKTDNNRKTKITAVRSTLLNAAVRAAGGVIYDGSEVKVHAKDPAYVEPEPAYGGGGNVVIIP